MVAAAVLVLSLFLPWFSLSTDPDVVSAYVLSRFDESDQEVRALVQCAADEAERLVMGLVLQPSVSQ